MCFRPAEVAAPQVCPQCGAEIGIVAGIRQKNCPFCKAELPNEASTPVQPDAVPSPTAPHAPASPVVSAPVSPRMEKSAASTGSADADSRPKPVRASEKKPFNPFNR